MKTRGGTKVQWGTAKRSKREERERKADRAKGRQNDKKLVREGREEANR